ncbi:glutathione S-transferase N-terminal domain-containing protein [Candidatus Uabimicrobium sp. HlEnr_7]|uniref:glutathione S-transferase N-terminal domain-containing protein n=1 Tax=Candidatus Uabimicrobium helgolandensis TaxID=3095367 RepID=UPI003558C7E0
MKDFKDYTLYYSPYCPFCVRVLNAFKGLDIEISMKDTGDSANKKELVNGGGKATVPCLKHPDGTWQYESLDIIDFVKKKL